MDLVVTLVAPSGRWSVRVVDPPEKDAPPDDEDGAPEEG